MVFQSINPYNLEVIGEYEALGSEELQSKLRFAAEGFSHWRLSPFTERSELLNSCSKELLKRKEELSQLMVAEMGKPIIQAKLEIEKCAWVCRYYAENGESFLRPQHVDTDARESWIRYDPIGVVLAIMPWNFPFWQVFRWLAPTLMAGNTGLLKHAPNVFGCSTEIENILMKSGAPEGIFQNLIVDIDQVPIILQNKHIQGVSLTGSEKAGSAVASIASGLIKKSVLELGGSNAFIVLEDADLKKSIEIGIAARMQNNGQSCIAAKRFLIHEKVYDDYIDGFKQAMVKFVNGDPRNESTTIGPLARVDLAEKLEEQVKDSQLKGAKLLLGGKRVDAFFEPTILTDVAPGMPANDEELFGPVASFRKIHDLEEAIEISNSSDFGLGVTIFTSNPDSVKPHITQFEDGAVFINEMVKSDPRLPFGGTKRSGIGRELGIEGIREFCNVKTVYIN